MERSVEVCAGSRDSGRLLLSQWVSLSPSPHCHSSGNGWHGGILDGLAATLFGMGIPEYHAKRYEGRVKEGRILLSVYVDSSDGRAKHTLERTGADDISTTEEESAEWQKSNNPLPRAR